MKNVHLLPTDKSSRLYKTGGFLLLDSRAMPNNTLETKNQYIYITSDEEIKEGDWLYYKYFGEDIICKYNTMDGQNTNVNEHMDFYKKIILTTDQDLIADGVQAIDDEFLEWFVKNPSCEEVEVQCRYNFYAGQDLTHYKIIIPKEESFIEYTNTNDCTSMIYNSKEKPKQETLEDIKLEEVFGSNYCQFSVIENKLAILYRNQEQLLKAIKLLSNETRNT